MRPQTYKHDPDVTCAAIGERQFGLVARGQALEAGMSPDAIKRRLRSGRWKKLLPGVYLIAGISITWATRMMAAVLWAGDRSAASHRAAAHVLELDGFDNAPIEVSLPFRKSTEGVVIHYAMDLPPRDITVVRGIPITNVHRTLIDLGDVCSPQHVEDALDSALRRGLTSAGYLAKQLERIGTHGRKGASLLKELLASDDVKPSWLERRFIRLLGKTELPPYAREHPALCYRIDFAWPGVRMGVEVHGGKWHQKRLRWGKDLARHNALTAAGWTILHFTWAQLREEPDTVIAEIVSTYRRLAGFRI
jgi:very-short-patch-repair endonuclease